MGGCLGAAIDLGRDTATALMLYIARLDAHGRSTVTNADGAEFLARPNNLDVAEIWASRDTAPDAGSAAALAPLGVGVSPGEMRTLVSRMRAGYDSAMHRTETVDFSVVVAGQVDFVVETGVVSLTAGDCVLDLAVLHGWRSASGCTIAVTMTGFAPEQSAGRDHGQ